MSKQNIQAIYRLTPLQEGILYHTIRAPEQRHYQVQFSCQLTRLEHREMWQRAWQAVCDHYPIMRTLFTWDKREQPLQIVRERVEWPIQWLDWQAWPESAQASGWAALLADDQQQGFEMTAAPLSRMVMVEVAPQSFRLLWSFHHILIDGWSQRQLFERAIKFYHQLLEPQANSVLVDEEHSAESECRFQDVVSWIYQHDQQAGREFFREQLATFSRPSLLADAPANHMSLSSSEVQAHRGHSRQQYCLSAGRVEALANAAKRHQVTLNTLMLGVWTLALADILGQHDLLFGTTVSGRQIPLAGVEKTAGLLINTLPLRIQLSSSESLATWLQGIQQTQVTMRKFEQMPLVEIHKLSQVSTRQPLFDAIVVFENIATHISVQPSGPDVSQVDYTEHSHFPFALLIDPNDGLELLAIYDPTLLHSELVKTILAKIDMMAELICTDGASVENPARLLQRVGRASLHELAIDSSSSSLSSLSSLPASGPMPSYSCLSQWFEFQADQTPDAVALVAANEQLTYRQLNQRANQLARLLSQRGIQQDHIVAIILARDFSAVIAFLAVLKTGAAYVPIDASSPAHRIRYLLGDLTKGSGCIISHSSFQSIFTNIETEYIFFDQLMSEMDRQVTDNLQQHIESSSPAYIIYTSGSSGRPKGVVVEHAQLINSTQARVEYYSAIPKRFLLLSSFATDSSIAGLYWTLCTGGTLVLAPHRIEQQIDSLTELLAQQQISHTLCIPSLYQLVLEHADSKTLSSLRTVIVAGEACPVSLITQHNQTFPFAESRPNLYNEYGPSECTVWATVAKLSSDNIRRVPIGRPILNCEIYVLDQRLNSVADGEIGELFIGGNNLARGYLGQPDKTAEVFVSRVEQKNNGQQHTARLYRTGDLVRINTDGELEFFGRVDNQIKLRGYRFEPEDIENSIALHPSVKEVAVFLAHSPALENSEMDLAEQLALLSPEQAEQLLEKAERYDKFEGNEGLKT